MYKFSTVDNLKVSGLRMLYNWSNASGKIAELIEKNMEQKSFPTPVDEED